MIAASSNGSINGVIIALEDDSIFCPACKSQGRILCVGPRIPETWNGKQVALEKDLCICGCFPSPRLIANQSLRCQVVGDSVPPIPSDATTLSAQPLAPTFAKEDAGYDLDFLLTDEKSGYPLPDCPYTIELGSGLALEGKTDRDGKTSKVAARYAEHAILRVYSPDPTSINPAWDR